MKRATKKEFPDSVILIGASLRSSIQKKIHSERNKKRLERSKILT